MGRGKADAKKARHWQGLLGEAAREEQHAFSAARTGRAHAPEGGQL